MKNIFTLLVIILAVCLLQACNSDIKKSEAKTDSETTVSDDDTANAVQDTSTTINLNVDKADSLFAVTVANGDITELALGKLAVKNGKDKKVKNFGMMMVKEHGKTDSKLSALAKAKNITLPAQPADQDQAVIKGLSNKSGNDFDRAYIKLMMDDHYNDIKLFKEESKKIQDPDLKAFAVKYLPILQKHLDAINAIHDSMSH